ncbi:MAG TPA: hypothetical protein VF707_10325 [Ardenticatenaceae bacterium]
MRPQLGASFQTVQWLMARDSALRAAPVAASIREHDDLLADRPFLGRLGLFYVALSLLVLFTLDRFWSANWDAETFLHAARTFRDGSSAWDLYEKSREARTWPYAYPPAFAIALAPFVWLADVLSGQVATGPLQLAALRVPILIADIAIATLLHRILRRATGELWIARLGAAVWLFNPILFYHTAVQAHLESLWLWPTLAAYSWLQERGRERAWWPMLLLVAAMAVKQSAVLYAAPFALWLLAERRWKDLATFALLFVLGFGGLALPFLLHSDDFRFMLLDFVAQMPVQVQSWQVWTLALPAFAVEQTRTTFPTVRYATLLVAGGVTLSALWGLRKGRSWYAIGTMVILTTFLLSHKVMAYHYPMLLPWLIVWGLRTRRFGTVALALVWTSWVLVSPYFAPWASASHLPFYALLGTLNSIFYGWLLWQVIVGDEQTESVTRPEQAQPAANLARWMVLLATGFIFACIAQPITALLPRTLPMMLSLLGGVLFVTLLGFSLLATRVERALALPASHSATLPSARYIAVALLLVPLFFTWFTMTAEVTAVIEKGVTEAWALQP